MNDFSSRYKQTQLTRRGRMLRWGVYGAVLAAHVLLVMGIHTALALQRLDAPPNRVVEVVILSATPSPAPQLHAAAKQKSQIPQKPQTPQTPPEPQEPQTSLADKPLPEEAAALAAVPLEDSAAEASPAPAATATTDAGADVASSASASTKSDVLRYTPPDAIRLQYVVTKGSDSAKATLTWRRQNQPNQPESYDLTYEASYFGLLLLKQTSAGALALGGLMPLRFGDKRRGKSEQATHFEHDKQRITFSNNHPEAPLKPGAQDRVSVLIQLTSLLAAEPRKRDAGQTIELPVANTDELETWTLEVQGEETLALPAGEMRALRLLRRPRRAFDQTLELWLAPGLSYLPVRILQSDSSGVTDVQMSGSQRL